LATKPKDRSRHYGVAEWLRELEIEECEPVFRTNAIDERYCRA